MIIKNWDLSVWIIWDMVLKFTKGYEKQENISYVFKNITLHVYYDFILKK